MKKFIKTIASSALLALFALSSQAQDMSFGGIVFDHDIMMPHDFASLTMTQQPFGTSRYMAMGGAFTSLGADLTSMSVNPAGLGMYKGGDFSITPTFVTTNAVTANTLEWQGNVRNRLNLSNMSIVFNGYESASSPLISLSFGFGYNRIADFNTRNSFTSENIYQPGTEGFIPTVADVYGQQLATNGIYPNSDGKMNYAKDPYFWPAQMGYQTWMVDPAENGGWTNNTIGHNASVISSLNVLQTGGIDEYTFSLGGNISNFIYFGATLGMQSVYKSEEYLYQEEYRYSEEDGGYAFPNINTNEYLQYQLDYSSIYQQTVLDGMGYNLKLGIVARPLKSLRIGVAFHTPTYYSLARTYAGDASSLLIDNYENVQEKLFTQTPLFEDNFDNSWNFRSAPKLLTGVSYQLGGMGLISVDYERSWFNAIRVSNAPGALTLMDYKNTFKNNYKPVNTLRIGLEVKPISALAIRAGGGVSTSMLSDEALFYSAPIATDSNYFTCGVGFKLSRICYLDLAYQYYRQNYSQYKLFFSQETAKDGTSNFITESKSFNTHLNRNYVSLTLGFRI